MRSELRDDKHTAVAEIRRKNYLLHLVFFGTILSVFLVIVIYLRHPLSRLEHIAEDVPLLGAVAGSFIIFLAGLYIALMLSRQTLRIIEDYRSRLDRILSITLALREEAYTDILLEKIMDYALAVTDAEAGSLLLKENGKLIFKIVRGKQASVLKGKEIALGRGIIGWTAQEGMPVRIEDVKNDPHFDASFDTITGFETRSMLCIPLVTKDDVVGVLAILNKRGGYAFRPRDEEIVTYLAAQAGISIISTKFLEDQKNYEIHLTEILLDTMDTHIPEKKGHSRRVARFSNLIAKELELEEEDRKRIYFASLLHDVGFLKIDTDQEFSREAFEQHPVIGHQMISPINFYADIAPFILHHHERYDGHGYPAGLKGDGIPLVSRIISVAEAFDTMISPTSYKVPISFDEAVEELKRTAGAQFDPEIVRVFTNAITVELTV